jgi:hypothetical protein
MIRRKHVLVAAAVGTLAAAGIAYATIPSDGNLYTACMLKNVGTLRLIDKSLPSTSLMSHCTAAETEVAWNQKGRDGANGTNGKDGVSVTTAAEPPGGNCTGGGVQLTAANGIAYVCNGRNGDDTPWMHAAPQEAATIPLTDAASQGIGLVLTCVHGQSVIRVTTPPAGSQAPSLQTLVADTSSGLEFIADNLADVNYGYIVAFHGETSQFRLLGALADGSSVALDGFAKAGLGGDPTDCRFLYRLEVTHG